MIDIITAETLHQLAEARSELSVSIYFPTFRVGDETAQNPIRLKNLSKTALRELKSLGMHSSDASSLMSDVAELEEDSHFWRHVGDGLAIFLSEHGSSIYRLPYSVDELVVVAERFHLKPLIPAMATGENFYVLVLSQNQVRLLRGSRYSISELSLREIPHDLAEVLRFDDREPHLQSHAASRVGTGRVTATFHGQGIGKDTRQADVERFLSAVDSGVCQILAGSTAPLLLVGVTETTSTYRRLSKYRHLMDAAINGSGERMGAGELHDRTWPLVKAAFETERHAAEEAIRDTSMPSAHSVDAAIPDAIDGRVAALFVPLGVQLWGSVDRESRKAIESQNREPGDYDLMDYAAIETLSHRGQVFVVDKEDIPGGGAVAAQLRY